MELDVTIEVLVCSSSEERRKEIEKEIVEMLRSVLPSLKITSIEWRDAE